MRWPIRNQILFPFVAILLTSVATIAMFSAQSAARRTDEATRRQLQRVIDTLGDSQFPLQKTVLEKMRGLSGADFVAYGREGMILAATPPPPELAGLDLRAATTGKALTTLGRYPVVRVGSAQYFIAQVEQPSRGQAGTLFVLYPEESWRQAQWDAAWPPLLIGAGTAVLTALASFWLAHRMAGRIRSVQQHVARAASGEFREVPLGPRQDEIHELVASVNRMCLDLRRMQELIRQSERSRLLGQLAGGLAHQLRNAVTGARMAVQIHQRRCRSAETGGDASLDVVLRQLTFMEEQVRGFLSLGKHERRAQQPCRIGSLLDQVAELIGPACEHAHVRLECAVADDLPEFLADVESLRSAVLNLALNAVEACGPHGQVTLTAQASSQGLCLEVRDDGPGPPAALAESLFEPFVTGKPEGVGLGLALVRQVADDHGGEIDWRRDREQTVFRLRLPLPVMNPPVAVGRP